MCLKNGDERIAWLGQSSLSAFEARLTIGGKTTDWSWVIPVAEEFQSKLVCLQSCCGMAGKNRR